MMNFTNKVGAVAAATFVLASTANAATFSASASFRTIADISITENAALSFGTSVTGKAGTICTVDMTIASGGANADPGATTTVQATGTGCGGTIDSTAGEYLLTGAAGSSITITMATVSQADYDFAPAGIYSDLANVAVSVETAYFADAPFNVTLEGGGGTGRLAVGGLLSVTNNLAASTSFTIPYDVLVVY